jgi:hypothetical protein
MRINIKTKKPIKDKEIKALFIIGYALELISPRMIRPTLEFFVSHFGYKLEIKE